MAAVWTNSFLKNAFITSSHHFAMTLCGPRVEFPD